MSSELDALYGEQSAAQSQRQALEAQLSRLRTAKKRISDLKSDVKSLKKDVGKKDDYKSAWAGDSYDLYLKHNGYLIEDYGKYYDRIEDLVDAIQDRIKQLDGQLSDTIGWLSWVGYKISNFFSGDN